MNAEHCVPRVVPLSRSFLRVEPNTQIKIRLLARLAAHASDLLTTTMHKLRHRFISDLRLLMEILIVGGVIKKGN